jgi:hypothetical protein
MNSFDQNPANNPEKKKKLSIIPAITTTGLFINTNIVPPAHARTENTLIQNAQSHTIPSIEKNKATKVRIFQPNDTDIKKSLADNAAYMQKEYGLQYGIVRIDWRSQNTTFDLETANKSRIHADVDQKYYLEAEITSKEIEDFIKKYSLSKSDIVVTAKTRSNTLQIIVVNIKPTTIKTIINDINHINPSKSQELTIWLKNK